MIHVHIESPSVDALQGELAALLSGISKDVVRAAMQPDRIPTEKASTEAPVEKVAEAAEPEQPVVEAQPEQHTEAIEADEAPVEETVVEETKYPSMTDTRAVLNKLRAKKGPKAVKEILTAHGVSSFVDLDSADYAAVMAEAEEALNG